MSDIFGVEVRLIVALCATQLVFSLYGAGLRRPFGSLATIADPPDGLRQSKWAAIAADLAFLTFLFVMWGILITQMNIVTFIILAFVFAVIGDYLSQRIRLVPSFYISLVLAACAIALVILGNDGIALAFAAIN